MKHVRIYDNGGRTYDRFTAVYMNEPQGQGLFGARGMSEEPFHPLGFGMYCTAMPGRHLGRRIAFDALPLACQKAILRDLGEDQ